MGCERLLRALVGRRLEECTLINYLPLVANLFFLRDENKTVEIVNADAMGSNEVNENRIRFICAATFLILGSS